MSQPDAGSSSSAPVRSSSRLVLVLVAVVAALAGAVGAGFLVTAVVLRSAQDIGEEIGAALAPTVEDSISDGISRGLIDGMEHSMEDAMVFAEEGSTPRRWAAVPWSSSPPSRVKAYSAMSCTELE
jgi:hypothetical protein